MQAKKEDKRLKSLLVCEENMQCGYMLKLFEQKNETVLHIISPKGQLSLSISITTDGPVLNFESSGIKICSTGDIDLEAENLNLRGRKSLALLSDGNLDITAKGDIDSHARIQNITADMGNTNIKANDDVKINGERVMVNC